MKQNERPVKQMRTETKPVSTQLKSESMGKALLRVLRTDNKDDKAQTAAAVGKIAAGFLED